MSVLNNLEKRLFEPLVEFGQRVRDFITQGPTPALVGVNLPSGWRGNKKEGGLDACFVDVRGSTGSLKPAIDILKREIDSRISKELSASKSWNAMLKPLENEAPQRFAESLSYLIEALNHSEMTVGVIRAINEQNGWEALAKVIRRMDQREHAYFKTGRGLDLTIRALRGINESKEDRGKESKFLATMSTYDGEPDMLRDFCLNVGHGLSIEEKHVIYNPYAIARKATFDFPAIEDLPSELVGVISPAAKGTKKDSKDERGESGPTYYVKSSSGRIITSGEVYRAYSPSFTHVQFRGGRQAVLKIAEAFFPEEYSPEARRTRPARKEASISEAVQELRAGAGPDLDLKKNRELRSALYRRNQELVEKLQREIEQYRGEIHRKLFGELLISFSEVDSQVQSDVGGRFMGSFRRRRDSLPEAQRYAFDMLDDNTIRLSRGEELFFLSSLLVYDAATRPINKLRALSPWLSDLNEYKKAHAEDPTELNKVAAKEASVKDILHGPSIEIDFTAVGKVLNALDFLRHFRVEENRRFYAAHREEIELVLKRFEPYFKEGGKWREDSMGASIPMGRLEETLIGKKIGHYPTDRQKRAVLNRDDWHAIREVLFMYTVSGGRGEQILSQMSVADFGKIITRVLTSSRRVDDFEIQFAGRSVKDRMHVGSELDDWNPTIIPSDEYTLASDYFRGRRLSAEEFLKRLEARSPLESETLTLARVGLVKENKELYRFEKEVRTFKPVENYEEKKRAIEAVLENPLILPRVWVKEKAWELKHLNSSLDSGYLYPSEAAAIEVLMKARAELKRLGLEDNEKAENIKERLAQFEDRVFIMGEVNKPRISMRMDPFTVSSLYESQHGIRYIPPKAIEDYINNHIAEHPTVSELGAEWVRRYGVVVSQENREALVRMGYTHIPTMAWKESRAILSDGELRIQRSFAEAIDRLYEVLLELKDRPIPKGAVLPNSNWLVWKNGEIVINFGKYRGRELFSLLSDSTAVAYIRDFMGQKVNVQGVREIAREFSRRVEGGSLDKQDFYDWVLRKKF